MENENKAPTEQNTIILEELTNLMDENTGYQKEIAFWAKVTGTYFLIKLIVLAIQIGLIISVIILISQNGYDILDLV